MNLARYFLVLLSFSFLVAVLAIEPLKDEMDKVIETEITEKLTEDLIQSLERKFQTDLEKSVNMVLTKIKLLLQNGTTHIQDKMQLLQKEVDGMKEKNQTGVEKCLTQRQNDTAILAENALHQMVLCGYALIGHDPAQALAKVIDLKQKIKTGIKPVSERRTEVLGLLKLCGHEHDSLKKVIKCVIAKSPMIKSSMMEVTSKLIEGVVDLTKLMAHGAMHEACLIEVVKTVEDEAISLLQEVKKCAFGHTDSDINDQVKKYIAENNATVLDVPNKKRKIKKIGKKEDVSEMKTLIRRMLSNDDDNIDKHFKKKLQKMEKRLNAVDGQ